MQAPQKCGIMVKMDIRRALEKWRKIMAKMYLEINNGNNGILIDADGKWMYFDASEINADISEYTGSERNVNAALNRIRDAIKSGDLYSADEFADEFADDAEHIITDYDGFTLDAIDNAVNYENNSFGDRVPMNHDITEWHEI